MLKMIENQSNESIERLKQIELNIEDVESAVSQYRNGVTEKVGLITGNLMCKNVSYFVNSKVASRDS